jgi:hypothetical protein
LRAGTTNVEPVPVLHQNGDLELNINFETMTAEAGNIANGLDCEIAYPHFPFVYIQRPAEYATVTATQNADLWLLVGTRSGYEDSRHLLSAHQGSIDTAVIGLTIRGPRLIDVSSRFPINLGLKSRLP